MGKRLLVVREDIGVAGTDFHKVPGRTLKLKTVMMNKHNKRRPNLIFVLTDDQGYGDLGCHGNDVIRTPNLDRFHGFSVRFTDYHVGTTCAPTRSGLLTGHYCNSAGVWHTIGGRSLLREDEWTLADAYREAGYATAHFGKWHLGDSQPYRPHERGFDRSVYHAGGGIGSTGDVWGNDYFDDTFFVNGRPEKFEGYCTDVFFREALTFIEDHAAEPFFCYIATNAPHGPLNIEDRYVEPYRSVTPHENRARFYGMIENIDENFGVLEARLEKLGIADDTILVFMTDNGTASGIDLDEHGFPLEGPGSFNAGMRGQKGFPYEGGHRVPFLIRYPNGGIGGGRDCGTLTSYVDFMPTMLDLCDVPVPDKRTFHGRSLVPLMSGETGPEWDERVIVSDTQRIARPMKWRQSSVMRDKWRLVNGNELYDLRNDTSQRHDIADERLAVVQSLWEAYEEWWKTVNEQFDRDIPIAVGQDDEPVKITTHDIRNEACDAAWNHAHVRQGKIVSGHWEIDVKTSGNYVLELRRWPQEAGHRIAAGIDGDDVDWRSDCVQLEDYPHYTGGVAMDIRWAQVTVGGQTHHLEIGPNDDRAVFELALESGPDHLVAAFHDRGTETIAPYYVYIRRME